jgi:hypothetical protein
VSQELKQRVESDAVSFERRQGTKRRIQKAAATASETKLSDDDEQDENVVDD